jgi:hypothetical protein
MVHLVCYSYEVLFLFYFKSSFTFYFYLFIYYFSCFLPHFSHYPFYWSLCFLPSSSLPPSSLFPHSFRLLRRIGLLDLWCLRMSSETESFLDSNSAHYKVTKHVSLNTSTTKISKCTKLSFVESNSCCLVYSPQPKQWKHWCLKNSSVMWPRSRCIRNWRTRSIVEA